MSLHAVDQLASEILILANLLRKRSARMHRSDGLPPAALQILKLLRQHGPLTVPQIGRLRVTSRQNVQFTVNRLRAAGLVEFASNPAHKRSALLQLTPAALARVDGAANRDSSYREELAARLPEEQTLKAVELLRRLRQAIEDQNLPVSDASPAPEPYSAPASATPPTSSAEEEIPVSLL